MKQIIVYDDKQVYFNEEVPLSSITYYRPELKCKVLKDEKERELVAEMVGVKFDQKKAELFLKEMKITFDNKEDLNKVMSAYFAKSDYSADGKKTIGFKK
jgi:methyl coenzyme M reductase beta subunit